MSGQSSDIKQLFSHLGLNPGDYLEIRPKPASNATRSRTEAVIPEELLMPRQPTPQEFAALLPAPEPAAPDAIPAPETVVIPAMAQAPVRLLGSPATNDQPVTVVVPVAHPAVPVVRENLESLFRQVSEPPTAGASAEELEEDSSASLKDLAAEAARDSTITSRRISDEDVRGNQALDAALAKLKDASSRLQVPHQSVHTGTQAGSGSSLLDVFRRISKKY